MHLKLVETEVRISMKTLLIPSCGYLKTSVMSDGTEARIDHTKSKVGYKSNVWFGASVRCATKLKLQKVHFPYKMDAKELWPIGGLTSVRRGVPRQRQAKVYMVGNEKSVAIDPTS